MTLAMNDRNWGTNDSQLMTIFGAHAAIIPMGINCQILTTSMLDTSAFFNPINNTSDSIDCSNIFG